MRSSVPCEEAANLAGCKAVRAELWEQLNFTDPINLYNAACYRSVTASAATGTDPSYADEQAKCAMNWLLKAVAAGYTNVSQMKKDKYLDYVRNREDFKKLVAELEKSQ